MGHYDWDDDQPIRRTNSRRKPQIQKQPDQTLQNVEAVATWIRETMDSYWLARSQWLGGFIRPNIYLGFREGSRTIYNTLPEGILPPSWLQSLRLGAKQRRVGESHGENITTGTPAIRGRLSTNAQAAIIGDFSYVTELSDAKLSELGKRILREARRRRIRSRKPSGRRTKAKTNR